MTLADVVRREHIRFVSGINRRPSDITVYTFTPLGKYRYWQGKKLEELKEGKDYHKKVIPYRVPELKY